MTIDLEPVLHFLERFPGTLDVQLLVALLAILTVGLLVSRWFWYAVQVILVIAALVAGALLVIRAAGGDLGAIWEGLEPSRRGF